MDIAFISLMIPDHLKEYVHKYQITPMEEVSTFIQKELIEGLKKQGIQVKVVNKLHIYEFPKKFRKLRIEKNIKENQDGIIYENLPFINLPIFSKVSFYIRLKRKMCLWAQQCSKSITESAVIAYTCTWYNLLILKNIKKKNPQVITSIIIPDLPSFMHATNGHGLKGKLRKRYLDYMDWLIQKTKKDVDLYILFSEMMADYIGCKEKFIVMEGVAKNKEYICISPKTKRDSKRVFYGGGICEEYGVRDLIEAFHMIKTTNIELVLCGAGDLSSYAEEMEKKDKRIKYYGYIPYIEAQRLLLDSDIVVNPRKDGMYEFTKYSFPSKNLDTLSYGKPLIGYKLEGIPDEYDDFMIYVEDHNISTLSRTIEEVCGWEENRMKVFGEAARRFVRNNKTGCEQSRKILNALQRHI